MKPDPKPTLSPKTIETNILYHQAIIRKYQDLIDHEQRKIEQWQKELSQQSSSVRV